MHSPLHRLLARAHVEDLRRAGASRRWAAGKPAHLRQVPAEGAVTLRFAFPDDAQALARLAALDSSGSPMPQVLLAEVDGELHAALSLFDGTVVADPFQPAVALIELLSARAQQLSEAGAVRRRKRATSDGRDSAWRGRARRLDQVSGRVGKRPVW